MYKIFNTLANIKKIDTSDNDFYYTKDQSLFVKDFELIKDIEEQSLIVKKNFIFCHDNDGMGLLLFNKKKHETPSMIFANTYSKNTMFFGSNLKFIKRKLDWDLCEIDVRKNIILKTYKIKNFKPEYIIKEKKVIGTFNESQIISFSVDLEKINWNYDLSPFLNLDNSIYNRFYYLSTFENQILIACKQHTILSLDINNGKLLHLWRELPGINPKSQAEGLIPDSKSFVLDKKASKLIGAFHKDYIEIDLKTKAIHFVDIIEELQKHDIIFIKQLNNNPFTETHLFLTAMMQQDTNDNKWSKDCLFALNRETLKIDWLHVFKEQNLGTNIPKLTDNELYQLDNDGTLHIFTKQVVF